MSQVRSIFVNTNCRWIEKGLVEIKNKEHEAELRTEFAERGYPEVEFLASYSLIKMLRVNQPVRPSSLRVMSPIPNLKG
ncbi:hypothetical protein UFOVP448_28 [uncultured Caudovirales phage]|uniref:Uncharacterized protein n=1 Tax=uncultured Caudovirales phage TaxID=2100421 RepID=A0A6J5M7L9_9CAUD|nr:hypothetical protein UFOVP448_28 [uncultured Caudovirales phage]